MLQGVLRPILSCPFHPSPPHPPPYIIGDGANAVLQGVLRAAGRQALGAVLNLSGYWLVGVPLAVVLGFKAHLGVVGFWTALLVTTSMQALLQVGGGGGGGAQGLVGCGVLRPTMRRPPAYTPPKFICNQPTPPPTHLHSPVTHAPRFTPTHVCPHPKPQPTPHPPTHHPTPCPTHPRNRPQPPPPKACVIARFDWDREVQRSRDLVGGGQIPGEICISPETATTDAAAAPDPERGALWSSYQEDVHGGGGTGGGGRSRGTTNVLWRLAAAGAAAAAGAGGGGGADAHGGDEERPLLLDCSRSLSEQGSFKGSSFLEQGSSCLSVDLVNAASWTPRSELQPQSRLAAAGFDQSKVAAAGFDQSKHDTQLHDQSKQHHAAVSRDRLKEWAVESAGAAKPCGEECSGSCACSGEQLTDAAAAAAASVAPAAAGDDAGARARGCRDQAGCQPGMAPEGRHHGLLNVVDDGEEDDDDIIAAARRISSPGS